MLIVLVEAIVYFRMLTCMKLLSFTFVFNIANKRIEFPTDIVKFICKFFFDFAC